MSWSDAAVTILSDHVCELGEGPSYDPISNCLYWFDILGRKLLEKPWPDGQTIVHDLPEMASAIAAVDGARQLVLTETGLWLRNRADGRLERHTEIEADNPSTRSNDARVHPCGAFWIGTMGKKAQAAAGAIYWHFKGELRVLFPDITIPNSICFSPDGTIAYFTDSKTDLLWRVDCDAQNGLPTGEPKVLLDHRGKPGSLDGSVVDQDGNLWNARWGAGALDAYDTGGRLLGTIDIPARRSTCPAFAGPDVDRLIVTSAWEGMDEVARRDDPHAGKTFLVDLPVKGRLEPRAIL